MAWLSDAPADDVPRGARRTGAALVLAGLTLVAAVVAAVVILTDRDEDAPAPHRGEQQAAFRSADGRTEAAVYWFTPIGRFAAVTEVVLLPADGTADRAGVSFGCTEDDDGLTIVAVTVLPDSIVTRNHNGDERTIHFDPRTLQPEATLGSC
ncbi:hypothetical protein AB0M46_32080 [Dactylosporangium sp. NPDC051485]|uniref:hypothetical protein n=1 Tax=Dactylosporangium sp. NPDC051485 TaxID=3154846 RepID=UPI00341444B3